ncbi:MAG: DNA-directed RNA polymerase subunit L [Candidatus Methanomethylicia archaeon]|jgi:DNA-directed RNA polymerase subunit L|uniref:DNA-directed RNA polymerase subunit Rpo11 n=1 Tax=Thermoproteota archaeon TaxID=2056631 RepID=A0A523B9T7_9CREN|nr:DNA-directed RNA polymerase subunit L [Candidatus Methanomethylicia archaeon]MCQ5340244.1 DNA-directed RNA polymerase subunit L [Candidatus Methanomethylicia archaeon]NHV45201.1 DNA-directed RNA polymerase subunit L [Candidatus Verstraetearchaeota archaeon]RZN57400.1 MAG: DNA-directed RNA polymerase subunit L [Candidatus Verstraetearchaeota archaeon]TDA37709.1 MAG: DNA-directed RNA polymerase subunit L [Candidatus Verstraetearchaeota archaeon]
MTIKVIKYDDKLLELEFEKEDHTIGNLLRSYLMKDKHVKLAGYRVLHPITGGIRLVIHTDGEENPKDALINAIQKIEEETKELQEKLKGLFKL